MQLSVRNCSARERQRAAVVNASLRDWPWVAFYIAPLKREVSANTEPDLAVRHGPSLPASEASVSKGLSDKETPTRDMPPKPQQRSEQQQKKRNSHCDVRNDEVQNTSCPARFARFAGSKRESRRPVNTQPVMQPPRSKGQDWLEEP